MSDCHRHIEMFLGALEGVASVIDHPLTEETRAALESALRYFREAAPKHTADEEESLFPRMRQKRDPNVEARALLRKSLYARAGMERKEAFTFHAVRCDRVVKNVFERIQKRGSKIENSAASMP